jgi:hypothetical protein
MLTLCCSNFQSTFQHETADLETRDHKCLPKQTISYPEVNASEERKIKLGRYYIHRQEGVWE